jgi:hypothetical protein
MVNDMQTRTAIRSAPARQTKLRLQERSALNFRLREKHRFCWRFSSAGDLRMTQNRFLTTSQIADYTYSFRITFNRNATAAR